MPSAKKSVTVDSSVFVSSLMPADKHFKTSRIFFRFLKTKRITIYIPISVFFEVLHSYFRLTNNINNVDLLYQKMIDWNLSKKLRLINLEAAFLVYFSSFHHMFDLKTADAIVAITALKLKQPLITWDKKLLGISGKRVKALTPESFLKK